MLGGVPISVVMPPRMVAKDSAISVMHGGRPALRAACTSIGIKSASAATLLITAESAAASPPVIAMCRPTGRVSSAVHCVMTPSAPEFSKAREATSTSATITTAGLEKPENAASCGTSPSTTAMSRPPAATRSWRKRPHTSMARMAANRPNNSV